MYKSGDISIQQPNFAEIWAEVVAEDVRESRDRWVHLAQQGDPAIIYFSIHHHFRDKSKVIGQIFLHDYDPIRGEALIGYHLFQAEYRGRGFGSTALQLLRFYVNQKTTIRQLTIITDQENRASQRVAQKGGFIYSGPAREGLPLICYQWQRQ